MSKRVNIDQLITEIKSAATATGFVVETYGNMHGYPLLVCSRPDNGSIKQPKQIYVSSGIHGDEPAPPAALLQLLQDDLLPREHGTTLCPCMNPVGLAAGTRENADGIDLNRDFTNFQTLEICSHRHWIESHVAHLDLAIHFHEDWEAVGFYLYELNFHAHVSRAASILSAAKNHVPIETATHIDGHRARDGVIRPAQTQQRSGGFSEALYFQQRYGLLNYTLETPSDLPIEQRIAALKAGFLAAVSGLSIISE